jgi:hypothetical protein
MTHLRKAFVVAGMAAAILVTALTETPFAQNSGSDPSKSVVEQHAAPNAASLAADKKAEAAMTVAPSAPLTAVDKKAAAAMGMDSSPVPIK